MYHQILQLVVLLLHINFPVQTAASTLYRGQKLSHFIIIFMYSESDDENIQLKHIQETAMRNNGPHNCGAALAETIVRVLAQKHVKVKTERFNW